MLETLVVALALAVDAAAAAAGLAAAHGRWRPIALASASFALFQAGMAGVGWLGGAWLTANAAAWDHWVAFGLLAAIGGRMVYGALAGEDEDAPSAQVLSLPTLLTLSVATSVDALAAGVSLPLLPLPAPVSVAVIGVVTLVCCGAAGIVGRLLARLGSRLEAAGGVVLILLGVKILVEHLGLIGG